MNYGIHLFRTGHGTEMARNREREAKSSSISLKRINCDHYRSRDNRSDSVVVNLSLCFHSSTWLLLLMFPPLHHSQGVLSSGWSPQVLFLQKFLIASKANLNFKESISWFMDWVYTTFICISIISPLQVHEWLVGGPVPPRERKKRSWIAVILMLFRDVFIITVSILRVYYILAIRPSILFFHFLYAVSFRHIYRRSGGVSHCVL